MHQARGQCLLSQIRKAVPPVARTLGRPGRGSREVGGRLLFLHLDWVASVQLYFYPPVAAMDHADYALFWPRTAAEMRRASPALLYLRRNQRSPARYAPHGSYRRLRISLPSRSAPLTGRPRYAAHIARPRVIARACDSTAPGPRRQSCFSGTDLLHLASAQSTTRRGPGTPSLARTPNSRSASEAHPRLERLVFRADLSLASLVRGLLTRCQRGSPAPLAAL